MQFDRMGTSVEVIQVWEWAQVVEKGTGCGDG